MTRIDMAGIRAVVALIEAEETAVYVDARYRRMGSGGREISDEMDAARDRVRIIVEEDARRSSRRVRELAREGRVPITAWIAAETAVRDGDLAGARDLVRWVGSSMARQGGAS